MLDRASIAVVIPSLHEAALIGAAVGSVVSEATVVLVVDGGSTDATVREAQRAGARVLSGPRGRAAQMERGAHEAGCDWLVFLHADTRLEPGWATAVRQQGEDVVGGAFRFALDSRRRRYRIVEAGVRLRIAALQLPFGDQALFARRRDFHAAGGFHDLPILEDVDFVRRLRRRGRLAFLPLAARTSARRWEAQGFLRTTLLNWSVLLLASAGLPLERLARIYARGNRAEPHARQDA